MTGKSNGNGTGTVIVTFAAQAENAAIRANIHYDASYVTQLIAGAAGVPQMPKRRRMERAEALAAYTAEHPYLPNARRTRRLV